jgi:hypothetical protein
MDSGNSNRIPPNVLDTPEKRIAMAASLIVLAVRESHLTRQDLDEIRTAIRVPVELLQVRTHNLGVIVDEMRARVSVLEAAIKYADRHPLTSKEEPDGD